MRDNFILKILSNIFVILIALYFSKILGVCLIILRCFVNKKKNISIYLLVTGILVFIPKILSYIINMFKITIPYLNDIANSNIYNDKFINYGEFLLILGIIIILITIIVSKINNKITNSIKSYINESEKKDMEIAAKNDLIMKEKIEKALNTRYVKCPTCGADNIISSKIGKCKYCRSALSNSK